MELYTSVSFELAEHITRRYSTSFSKSSSLFDARIRPYIFAIYGLVRIADEIVDTYAGDDARTQLDDLETEVSRALRAAYSTNPIVHAFAVTAQRFSLNPELLAAFFASMRTDTLKTSFTREEYDEYIYGSAEVIGLMCLAVFTENDTKLYDELSGGACSLGAAYQKVNFLRDIASDYSERGRVYFPDMSYDLADEDKAAIVAECYRDFAAARPTIKRLPPAARRAVRTSFLYYYQLLRALDSASIADIKTRRIRVSSAKKLLLFVRGMFPLGAGR